MDTSGNEILYTATAKDVARKYGISRPHVYNLANEGMPHRRVGEALRFNIAEVDEWMRSRTEAATTQPAA